MPGYRLSHQAQSDLRGIWDYIAANSQRAADRWIDKFFNRFLNLAEQPGPGPPREELRSGLRSLPVGNYLILYRRITDGVEIVRVLHGVRDIDAIFGSGES